MNPAFLFPQRNDLQSHQPRANRSLPHSSPLNQACEICGEKR